MLLSKNSFLQWDQNAPQLGSHTNGPSESPDNGTVSLSCRLLSHYAHKLKWHDSSEEDEHTTVTDLFRVVGIIFQVIGEHAVIHDSLISLRQHLAC